MKKFISFIIVSAMVCLGLGLTSPDLAYGFDFEGHNVLKFVIETDLHWIGDDGDAEGTSWERSFALHPSIKSTRTAFVVFSQSDLEMANLVINGNPIAIPYFVPAYADNWPPTSDDDFVNRCIAVPASAFYPGENTIGFESLSWPGNYDDFWFKNLVIYFQ